MIGSVRGTLLSKSLGLVLVECAGVGYELTVAASTLSELPETGKPVFLHVSTVMREDAIQLYGFGSEAERRLFMLLQSVSGIGPKVAVSIISSIPHDEFFRAIEAEDVARLTRVPGLGKKTASRLVLELKGKLPKSEVPADAEYTDTLSALVNLGYRKQEATDALDIARKSGRTGVEALLKESLRVLTAGGGV